MQISDFFISGDIQGAIAYMRCHEGFSSILPAYTALFEDEEYHHYDVPEQLNRILLAYQVYYRDVFYCGLPDLEASEKLFTSLRTEIQMPTADVYHLSILVQLRE